MGSRSERDKKWSQKAEAAEKVVQRAISFHSMANDVLAIKDRWAEPTSAAIKLTEDVIVAPLRSSHTFPALEFGHRAELSLIKCWRDHKQVSEIGDNKSHNLYVACFGDGGAVDGRVAWVVVNKYRYTTQSISERVVLCANQSMQRRDLCLTCQVTFSQPWWFWPTTLNQTKHY